MDAARFLAIAKPLLNQPTAPFCEAAVKQEILRQLKPLPHVKVMEDAFGNLIAKYQRGKQLGDFAFAAHMDHPGFVNGKFLGGVPERYFKKKQPVKNHGEFSMWDLPAFKVRAGKIHARVCDDLIGCAAIMAMFEELESTKAECSVYGLFTRAEEVGFVGAIQLAKSKRLPAKLKIISLETSSEKGGPVKMGDGVIVRVGDRTSIFDSSITATMTSLASAEKIPFQRALMQGGSCEATAYALYGHVVGGMCVALGNYHNCGPNDKIAAEYVSVEDCVGMANLCAALATSGKPEDPHEKLRKRLEKNLAEHAQYFGCSGAA